MRLDEHPLRRKIVGEMHLRRWPPLAAPAQIIQVLRLIAPERCAADRALLASLPGGGAAAAADNARHVAGELAPGITFVWELHSEACGVTLFFHDADAARGPALAWLERFGGPVIRATHIRVVTDDAAAGAVLPQLGFVESDLVSCHIGRSARLWSDFRIGGQGLGGALIAANGTPPADLGRLLQGFQELGNYRNLALMGLPDAQAHWPRLDATERALRDLARQIADPAISDDTLLERVSAVSLDLMSLTAETRYRLGATEAYARLVEERLTWLAPRPIESHAGLRDFTERRLLPAIRTTQAFGRRLDDVSRNAADFASLVRTRVETRIENQNARLLLSMERSSSLQLRLQQLVEGLSVVALSYYGIGLAGYVLKAVEHRFPRVPATEIIGLLVPLVVGITALVLHRMKARLMDRALH